MFLYVEHYIEKPGLLTVVKQPVIAYLLEALREHVQKEAADKQLLRMEIVIGITSTVFLFAMLAVGIVFMKMEKPLWAFFLPVGVGLAQFIVCMAFALRIEQTAGYYECRKCGHRYVPGYRAVTAAMHMGRTRYMKCPACGERSWQKKVVSKD